MNRMDDIWKDRFNSEDMSPGGFNTPDDLVWENIAKATVRGKKRPSALWLWLLVSLFALMMATFLLSNLGYFDQMATNEASTKTTDKNVVASSRLLNNDTATSAVAMTQNSAKEKSATSVSAADLSPTAAQVNTAIAATNNKIANSDIPLNTTIPNTTTPKADHHNFVLKDDIEIIKVDISKDHYISNISGASRQAELQLAAVAPFFELQKLAPVQFNEIPLSLDGFEPKKEPGTPSFPVEIIASIGTTYWQHQISQSYTSDLSAFDFNYTDEFGWMLDLDVNIPLGNHLSLQLGAEYEQIDVESGHNASLAYNPAEEGAAPNNAYALDLATPYGLSGAEFRFERNDEIGDDPLDLLVDFHSAHTIKNLSFPLMIEYLPLGKNRKFSPYLRGGMGLNNLSGISNRIQSIETHHDAIQYDAGGTSSFMSPDINKWHYDYRLGIGAAFRWQKNLALRIHYEYVGGINAIFEQDAYNTKINRHHISIGLSKVLLDYR